MERQRTVDWSEIRSAWETQGHSDAALARLYGFASKNTVVRRRLAEGWVRNPAEVIANVATRAVRGTDLARDVSSGHKPDTPGGHTEIQQNQASGASIGLGVSAQGHDTASLPTIRPIPHARPMSDRLEELAEIKATAVRRDLEAADLMYEAGTQMLKLVLAVARGPGANEDPEDPDLGTTYARSVIAARGINADKDTMAGLTKTAGELLEKGSKIRRTALGMDKTAEATEDASGMPVGILSPEQLVSACGDSLKALEQLVSATQEAGRIRPTPKTIQGTAE